MLKISISSTSKMTTEESSTGSAVRHDQNDWVNKLKHVGLDDLETVCTFARGGYSKVSLVRLDQFPDAFFALKTIKKVDIDHEERELVLSEKKILSEVHSDFIVKLYRTFRDKKALYLLQEYLPGGDVFDLAPLSENAAKFYVACAVEALDYLHKQNIVHNDIKPSNLVLDADGYAKLIDFGFALQLEENQKIYGNNWGTPGYMSPEVARPICLGYEDEGRDRACDLWALGVCLYELLANVSPFDPDDTHDADVILDKVNLGIDSLLFSREHFSEEAEDLIRNLCTDDPVFRLGYETMDEIREHRWFNDFDWCKLRERKLPAPIMPTIKSVEEMENINSGEEVSNGSDAEGNTSDWDKDF